MTRTAVTLRLGPLPRTDTIKLTIGVNAQLKQQLDEYAATHSQLHGEPVDAVTLIPHMLQAFIMRDRGFRRMAAKVAAAAQQSTDAGAPK